MAIDQIATGQLTNCQMAIDTNCQMAINQIATGQLTNCQMASDQIATGQLSNLWKRQ